MVEAQRRGGVCESGDERGNDTISRGNGHHTLTTGPCPDARTQLPTQTSRSSPYATLPATSLRRSPSAPTAPSARTATTLSRDSWRPAADARSQPVNTVTPTPHTCTHVRPPTLHPTVPWRPPSTPTRKRTARSFANSSVLPSRRCATSAHSRPPKTPQPRRSRFVSFSTPHTGRGNQQTRKSSQQSPSQVGDFGPARVTTSLRPPCTFTAHQRRRQPRGNRAPPNAAVSAAAPLTPRLLRRPSTAPPRTQPAPGTCQLSPERNGSTPQRLRRNQSRTRRARSTAHSRAAASITCAQPRVPNCRAPRAGQPRRRHPRFRQRPRRKPSPLGRVTTVQSTTRSAPSRRASHASRTSPANPAAKKTRPRRPEGRPVRSRRPAKKHAFTRGGSDTPTIPTRTASTTRTSSTNGPRSAAKPRGERWRHRTLSPTLFRRFLLLTLTPFLLHVHLSRPWTLARTAPLPLG